MKSRDYQKKAENAILADWRDGKRKVLAVMATGCGKTILFASVIRSQFPQKALVIAHREELIWQARDKIEAVTGLRVEVEMGEHKSDMDRDLFRPKADVVVATVQTLCAGGDGAGRLGKFNPDDFGILIIDECHHGVADGYRRVIDYMLRNPKLKILGVTATPDRQDEGALGQIFDSVSFDYEILDAIKDGWLVPIEQQMVSIDSLDFSQIRTVSGDLNGAALAEVMESEKNLHGIAYSTLDIAGDRRGIGFAASVHHAEVLSEIFNRHKPGMSACVSAKTDKEVRKNLIQKFANGRIQFMWNCGVFTEGFDDSGVEIIAMGRPTKSRALYAQMAGRATRPHESIAHKLNDFEDSMLRRGLIKRSIKPSCLILDFVGNSGNHKLITSADILGGNVSEEAIKEATQIMMRMGRPMKVAELLEEKEKEIEERKKVAFERKAQIKAKATYKTQSVDPFEVMHIKRNPSRGWDKGKILSEKQQNILSESMGLNPADFTYANAKQLIDQQFKIWKEGLCTFKMQKTLKKYGIDASNMKREVGSLYMDALKQNDWHGLPSDFDPPTIVNEPIPPRPQKQPIPFYDDIPF